MSGRKRTYGERDWIIEEDIDFQIALILRNVLETTNEIRDDLRREAEKALEARMERQLPDRTEDLTHGQALSGDSKTDAGEPVRGTESILSHRR